MSPMQFAKLPQNSESDVIRACAESLEKKKFTRFLKRTGDIFVSLVLLLLLSPVLLILSVWIALDSSGGVLFKQERVGRFGKPFTILNFRTMRPNNSGSQITTIAEGSNPNGAEGSTAGVGAGLAVAVVGALLGAGADVRAMLVDGGFASYWGV